MKEKKVKANKKYKNIVIEYKPTDKEDNFKLNISNIKRGTIKRVDEISESKNIDSSFTNDEIKCVEEKLVGIAPRHVKDFVIKKPDEKEPSLLKLIVNKIKMHGNSNEKDFKDDFTFKQYVK